MFFVTVLNHIYWVVGSTLGGLLGGLVTFNTKGIDFVTDQSSVQHDFQKSVSHSVFGSLADLSTEKDDVYYAEFFRPVVDLSALQDFQKAHLEGVSL